MYDIDDVVDYILYYENLHNRGVTNLRLQSLLYFVQAQFLINTGKPCFKTDIVAWNCGAVIPEVFHNYVGYGSLCINVYNIHSLQPFDYKQFLLVNDVLEKCSRYTDSQLSEFIFNQTPWKYGRVNNMWNNVINKEVIKQYFE